MLATLALKIQKEKKNEWRVILPTKPCSQLPVGLPSRTVSPDQVEAELGYQAEMLAPEVHLKDTR